MSNVISVSRLTKRFGQLKAVDDISFDVRSGQCFGLLGPNGAGKTTTIEMLEGITRPTSGEIQLFGQPASRQLYKRVGIQFQHTALQDFLTVKETLQLFQSLYDRKADLDTLIEMCALADYLHRDARKLSGGQRQRLLLALALVNDPDLVFLDEPTTGLDPQARRNFWSLIDAIKKRGKSVVLTTHYMDEAESLCDDIVIMDQGKIIEHGSPQALLNKHFQGARIRLPAENLQPSAHSLAYEQVGDEIEIQTEQVEQTLQTLLQQQVSIAGLQIRQPNLEDLFIKLTGHALRG